MTGGIFLTGWSGESTLGSSSLSKEPYEVKSQIMKDPEEV